LPVRCYTYDGDGLRASKTVSGTAEAFSLPVNLVPGSGEQRDKGP
jgi:hypothetical protein